MKTIIMMILAATLILPLAACGGDNPEGQITREISPAEAYTMIQENLASDDFVFLDVRTTSEYEAGHIAGAVLLDFNSGNFENEVDLLDKNNKYLIYCRTSNRSGQALSVMKNLGFMEVYDLDGGIVAWEAAGYPTTK